MVKFFSSDFCHLRRQLLVAFEIMILPKQYFYYERMNMNLIRIN